MTDGLGNSYQYDAESKIKSGPGATYSYTAEGQRVEKAVGSTTVDTVYFGGRPIARLSGGAWTDLVYAGGGLLAEVPGTQTGSPVYRVTDHLGSVVETLSSSGAVLGTQDLGPFGETFAGGVSDAFVFTGKERDAESGNDYFGARFYSSNIGRFMTPDWASQAEAVPYSDFSNPQSLNLYAYVSNNPTSRTDADGHLMAQGNSNGWWDPTSFYQFVRDSMSGGRRQRGGAELLRSPIANPENYERADYVVMDGAVIGKAGFRSLNKAAVRALDAIGQKGGKVEWGADLFKTSNGFYGYMAAVTQNKSSTVDPDDGMGLGQRIPDNADLAGTYHTHPGGGGLPEIVSGDDAALAQRLGVPGFVLTPSNSIIRYDPGPSSYLDGPQTYLRYHGVDY